MRYAGINPEFYSINRNEIAKLIGNESIALIFSNELMPRNGDQFYPFRQNSDFFYLTGIEQQNAILLLAPGQSDDTLRELLFVDKPDEKREKWEGKMLDETSASNLSGITTIRWTEDFESMLPLFLANIEIIYLNSNEYPKFHSPVKTIHQRKTNWIKETYPLYQYKRLQPLLIQRRLIKQHVEIERIKNAINITGQAFTQILKVLEPGLYEFEIEAEIIHQFLKNGANGHAYQPIVASGANALCLHYTRNAALCENDRLLLLDFGAEYANYAADCSRTIPINGKFNPRQREVYNAVLDVLMKASKLFTPGETIQSINAVVVELIQEKLVGLKLISTRDLRNQDPKAPLYLKYYYHGVSHFLGLDVHDPGGKEIVLKEGMILTCEPGIYIPEEGMGIRLENDILVASDPINLMADIPIEIEEIETIIYNSKKQKNV